MVTGKVIWVDDRFGENGWAIMILPFVIIVLPVVVAIHVYAIWFGDFTDAKGVRLAIAINLVFVCILFLGGLKYAWFLRKAPQRILLTLDVLRIHYFFGIEKTLPINKILSAKFIKQGVLASLFSPYGSRRPVLEVSFRDGPTLYLNGDCTQDSSIISLVRNVSK